MVRLVYFSGAATVVLAGFTVAAFRSTRGLSGDVRRYGRAAVMAAAAMCLAYVGMTTIQTFFEQRGFPLLMMELSRFVGYTLLWLPIVYVAGTVAGTGRRLTVGVFVAIAGQLWMTFCAWKVALVPQWLVLASPAVLLVGVYLLYGPVTRVARRGSEERLILYNKLKHTMFIGWFGQVMTVVVHPSTLGLTSVFTDWVTIMYVELVLVGAFVGLVFNNTAVFERIVRTDATSGPAGDRPADGVPTEGTGA